MVKNGRLNKSWEQLRKNLIEQENRVEIEAAVAPGKFVWNNAVRSDSNIIGDDISINVLRSHGHIIIDCKSVPIANCINARGLQRTPLYVVIYKSSWDLGQITRCAKTNLNI